MRVRRVRLQDNVDDLLDLLPGDGAIADFWLSVPSLLFLLLLGLSLLCRGLFSLPAFLGLFLNLGFLWGFSSRNFLSGGLARRSFISSLAGGSLASLPSKLVVLMEL